MDTQEGERPDTSLALESLPFLNRNRVVRPWKRRVVCLVQGQLISGLISATGMLSMFLAQSKGFSHPAFQAMLGYAFMGLLVLRFKPWKNKLGASLLVYLAMGVIDVEANFLIVSAYSQATVTSVLLLQTFTLPSVMGLTICMLHVRYSLKHFAAVGCCLGGLVFVVLTDVSEPQPSGGSAEAIWASAEVLVGSFLLALLNVTQEYVYRRKAVGVSELTGLMGLVALVVSGLQATATETRALRDTHWSWSLGGCLVAYGVVLFLLYVGIMTFIQQHGATAFNLSILTSHFYALLFELAYLGRMRLTKTSFLCGFILCMGGLIWYNLEPHATTRTDSTDLPSLPSDGGGLELVGQSAVYDDEQDDEQEMSRLVGGASPGPCDPSPRSQIVEVVVGSVLELNQQSIGDTTVEGGPRVSGTMNG